MKAKFQSSRLGGYRKDFQRSGSKGVALPSVSNRFNTAVAYCSAMARSARRRHERNALRLTVLTGSLAFAGVLIDLPRFAAICALLMMLALYPIANPANPHKSPEHSNL